MRPELRPGAETATGLLQQLARVMNHALVAGHGRRRPAEFGHPDGEVSSA
jgi:hypothetical protein